MTADVASLTIEADLPAVVSVTDQSGEARYPSMKGILAAKKKPVEALTLADLGVDPASVGLDAAWTQVQRHRAAAAEGGGPDRHRLRRGGCRRPWSSSWPPASTSDLLVIFLDSKETHACLRFWSSPTWSTARSTKPTLELLTLARRLGDPVAVVFGDGAEAAAETLGRYGATRVVAVTDPAVDDYLVAPKAEALQQVASGADLAAILISSTPEGKEIAGRLAVKLGSGLITDATDISSDGSTTQSVFAGNWTVTATVTQGVPVITVKPNAVAPEPAPGDGRGRARRGDHLRRGQDGPDRRPRAEAGQRPAGADRGGRRGFRRPRDRRETSRR